MPHSTERNDAFTPIKTLYVNDGPLPASRIGRMRSTDPSLPLSELHARYEEDGYLFLKGLIPRADVLRCRENYFNFLSPVKIIKPGTAPVEGIYNPDEPAEQFPGIGAGASRGDEAAKFVELCIEAHRQDWYYEALCRHPAICDFVAEFTGWGENTKGLKRSLLRNNTPTQKAIGVHYDQLFLRHGEPTSMTVWVPIGDIALEGGGLIYLEDSPALGRELEDKFFVDAKASGLTDEEAKSAFNRNMLRTGVVDEGAAHFAEKYDKRWLVSRYEAGDVVLHSPFTIHASTRNHDERGAIRLATDLRFVDKSRPYDSRWDKFFSPNDGV